MPRQTHPMALHQGDCITLNSDEHLYQVIGVDDRHNRCWVRRWPLARHGSPVFEISLQQVASSSHPHPPRLAHGA
ncbi:MAG: hypothetical protein FJ056_00045 [Cyanobacteria bacterium M_surface_10_m2_179]|nr:hypothetical protein [Cyanobacteria bacterium M_surface_10_m2_179]